jgi:signal peptidase II
MVPLTLAYNRGAAFGLSIGNDPRWFFIPVTLFALGLLAYLLLRTEAGDRFRIFALSLVLTGALGNLIDRVRWDRGVVDFIGPIDLGFMDWPIFNVADMAISCGAVALAISFWMEEAGEGKDSGDLPVEGDSEATT